MKTKIEKQNELIDAIIDWNSKGRRLGYSKAQELINEYERQAKLFAIPDVSGSLLTGYCCSHCGYKIIENENGDKIEMQ